MTLRAARFSTALALLAVLHLAAAPAVPAHASLRGSEPVAGATLPSAPTAVSLSFIEPPEPSLSEVRVVGPDGTSHHTGPPREAPGNPHSLVVPVGRLSGQVYVVEWRVVSRVDGHPSRGAFVFGIGVTPTDAVARSAAVAGSATSPLEVTGRWLFLIGLVGVLGAASARVLGFAPEPRADARRSGRGGGAPVRGRDGPLGRGDGPRHLPLATAGWVAAVVGFVLLAEAQRRGASASIAELRATAVGWALTARALGLLLVGAGLLYARRRSDRVRRRTIMLVGGAAAVVVGVHVEAGHAGGAQGGLVAIVLQWAHVVALAVWFGGLAALLLATRGPPSARDVEAVHRFSTVAAAALGVVVVTGVARSLDEVPSWESLASTGYGRALVVKVALLAAIAVLGGLNRWRNVPRVATDLRPLRRVSTAELGAAVVAITAAGLLASTVPPASRASAQPAGLELAASDAGTSLRLRLTTTTAGPGPTRFAVHLSDFDSGRRARADAVTLRFTPLDDVGHPGSSLALARQRDGAFVATGANLSLDGRWRVTALVERRGDVLSVPLVVDVPGPPHFVSVLRPPGQPVRYTVEITPRLGLIVSINPARAGRNRVELQFADLVAGEVGVDAVVFTVRRPSEPGRQHALRRLGPGRFEAEVLLPRGSTRITATGRAEATGARLRASTDVDVAG